MKNAIAACLLWSLCAGAAVGADLKREHRAGAMSLRGHAVVTDKVGNGTHADGRNINFNVEDNGGSMAIPKQVAKWSGTSSVPRSVQLLVAFSWICLMGSLPLITPMIEREPVTKTHIAVGCVLAVTVFGGFFLFTNIIKFQSVHFDTIRPLTVVECIYFMSQVITTVGYGDITPAYTRGMIFVGLYVIGALFVIAIVVSDVIEHLLKTVETYKTTAMKKLRETAGMPVDEEDPATARRRKVQLDLLLTPQKPDVTPLLQSIGAFLVIDICWICFFVLYPGEGKTWTEAAYMSLITLSTVGFGFFTPITEGGMIFGAFMMLFGSAAPVNVISSFTALMVMLKKYERLSNESAQESLQVFEEGGVAEGTTEISEIQFLRFGLSRRDICSHSDVEQILEAFKAYGPKDGKVSKKAIEESLIAAHPAQAEPAKEK